MFRYHLHKHRYKLAVGVPIAVLVASSLSFIRSPEQICIVPEDNRFVEVGEKVVLHVMAESDEPVNVIGADIHIPTDLLTLEDVSREGSIIDLWSQEPLVEDGSRVQFSGGIVSETGFLGSGIVLTLTVVPLAEGEATITFEDTTMLAHDGTGMEVICGMHPITLSIRPTEHPTPDVNGDNVVDIFDFGLVSSRLFLSYNTNYDLNFDGRITLADIGIVISNMRGNDRMGSLALLWRW